MKALRYRGFVEKRRAALHFRIKPINKISAELPEKDARHFDV